MTEPSVSSYIAEDDISEGDHGDRPRSQHELCHTINLVVGLKIAQSSPLQTQMRTDAMTARSAAPQCCRVESDKLSIPIG